VKVKLDRHELLTTQLYVEGDPGNARDFLWRRLNDEGRAALTRPFTAGANGWRAEFPIVVLA
jgi:protocatechuate 3,4-dioxygenase beta subunit